MPRIVDVRDVANVVCQDCNECDYDMCPYDCDFIKVILSLGHDIVYCGECGCFENNFCKYYQKPKTENGYCNAGYKKI